MEGPLLIETAKITTIMKAKNKLVVQSSTKYYVLIRKRDIKSGKHIAPMDFAEYLRKSGVSESSKVYYGRFLRNGLHERHCYISKSR